MNWAVSRPRQLRQEKYWVSYNNKTPITMTELKLFSDDVIKGKWARFVMADGNPCFLAIGPRSIVIKKSKTGIIGRRLIEVRELSVIEQIIQFLEKQFPQDLTPAEMTNRILKPLVNAVLHCREFDEVLSLFKSIETKRNLPSSPRSPS